MQQILKDIAKKNSFNLKEIHPLSGGDINAVYLLKCAQGDFVVKLHDTARFPNMFKAEANGLQLLRTSNSFEIPKILANGKEKGQSYLLLEYIVKGSESLRFWSFFAENLVKLHKNTQTDFGLDDDNYIGSLKQVNGSEKTSAEFYINQRLKPQLVLAHRNGFKFENLESFFLNISTEIPNEVPSLVHGDLWNGNYLVSEKGNPVLIDPAVAFAPREMDLAMMHLFGGFPQELFEEYHELFPLEKDWELRVPIFQLYYLLVHLNLFGRSYLPQVKAILRSFT